VLIESIKEKENDKQIKVKQTMSVLWG